MSQAKFQVYTFLGSWPWCFALAYIGMRLGERWDSDPQLRDFMHRFDAIIVGAVVVATTWYVRSHWRHRIASKDV
jgi:membrane protein DedA with SNARE-associated domain